MELDAFTFVAQVFNFALLVFLLQRFLYKPVLGAMQRREEIVAEHLRTATEEREAAEALAAEVQQQLSELEETRTEMLSDARHAADQLSAQLTESLKARMEERKKDWRTEQDRQAKEELREFRGAVSREIVSTIRLVLEELADETLEDRMVQAFARRIDELDPREVAQLIDGEEVPRLTVVSAFELDEAQRQRLQDTLKARFGDATHINFDVDLSRIAGLEIRCRGHRIGWSVAEYLESLNAAIGDQLSRLSEEPDAASA